MSDPRGHWCDFCQTYHSSMSCFHPGGQQLRASQAEVAALEAELAEITEDRDAIHALRLDELTQLEA